LRSAATPKEFEVNESLAVKSFDAKALPHNASAKSKKELQFAIARTAKAMNAIGPRTAATMAAVDMGAETVVEGAAAGAGAARRQFTAAA
jgi:hypothetical protein